MSTSKCNKETRSPPPDKYFSWLVARLIEIDTADGCDTFYLDGRVLDTHRSRKISSLAMWSTLNELGYQEGGLLWTLIHGDNHVSLALTEDPTHHQCSKHIDMQYHFILHEIKDHKLMIAYISTQ